MRWQVDWIFVRRYFDFAGAVKDWEKRKEEILKINF
jgi:hypothetical protein